jgi:hypothetical protein
MRNDRRTLAREAHQRPFDGDTGVPDHQRDAVSLQVRPKRRSSLWFLEAEERGSGFDHRHLGAEPCERLPQLDADGAAAWTETDTNV